MLVLLIRPPSTAFVTGLLYRSGLSVLTLLTCHNWRRPCQLVHTSKAVHTSHAAHDNECRIQTGLGFEFEVLQSRIGFERPRCLKELWR